MTSLIGCWYARVGNRAADPVVRFADLPEIGGESQGIAADAPRASLDLLDKDPGVCPDGCPNVGDNGFSDIRDNLSRPVLREFAIKIP